MMLFEEKQRLGKQFCSFDPITMSLLGGGGMNMGGTIFGGLFGSSAEKQRAAAIREAGNQGADAILRATKNANATSKEYLNTARGDLSPFRGYGVQAGDTLASLLMGGKDLGSLLQESDLFKFQSEMGSRNINRELAARGLYGSGAGLETLAMFTKGLAAEEGQRLTDRLFNLTQLGANSATNMAGLTTNTGNAMADRTFQGGTSAAQMRYNAALGAADANANATKMIGNMGQSLFNQVGQGFMQYGNFMMNKPLIDSSINANNAIAQKYGMAGG